MPHSIYDSRGGLLDVPVRDDHLTTLITPIGLRRLALTCAEGEAKYGAHNGTKRIPASCLINHALRHVNLWLMGDNTEDHLAHATWNLLATIHFEESRPELIDIPTRGE